MGDNEWLAMGRKVADCRIRRDRMGKVLQKNTVFRKSGFRKILASLDE
jgi:hypothetical protein